MKAAGRTPTTRDMLLAGAAIGVAALFFVTLACRTTDSTALAFLGRFHPLAVHLPIGMILLVGALEALSFAPALRARIDPALAIVLRLALASAVAAFALGSMLGSSGEYPERLLHVHQRLTFAMLVAAAASVVIWSLHVEGRVSRVAHRGAVLATLVLLGVGAHFGGSLTHGDDYLLTYAPAFLKGGARPLNEAPMTLASTTGDRLVWDDVVLPILKDRCASCHGAESSKGRLRVDSVEALMTGGKSGPAVLAGDSAGSLLVKRIHAPLSDDTHMPPDDKPQLDPAEIELLALWIERGASAETKVRDLIVPDGARRLLLEATGADAGAGAVTPRTSPAAGAPPGGGAMRAEAPSAPDASASATTRKIPAAINETASRSVAAPTLNAGFAEVAPILASKCGRCHGEAKQRGKLRTDSLAALVAGGASGPAIVPATAKGTLLERVRLPLDHPDHMPPRDVAQLDTHEMQILSSWIGRGAPGATRSSASIASSTMHSGPELAAGTSPSVDSPGTTESVSGATSAASGAHVMNPVRLFDDVVQPILTSRCGKCHSAERPAAGLVATQREALLADGHVVPGHPDASPLLARMLLPSDHEDHMPPSMAPQPSSDEVDAVRLWIERGASTDVVDASEVPPSLFASTVHVASASRDANAGDARSATSPDEKLAPAKVHGGCAGCAVVADNEDDGIALVVASLLVVCVVVRRRPRARCRSWRGVLSDRSFRGDP